MASFVPTTYIAGEDELEDEDELEGEEDEFSSETDTYCRVHLVLD